MSQHNKYVLWIIGVLGLVAIIALGVVLGRSRTHSKEALSSLPPKKSISEPAKPAFPPPSFFSNQANLRAVAASSNIVAQEQTHATAQGNELDEARKLMSRKAYDKAREMLEAAYAATINPDQKMVIGQSLYECLVRTHAYDEALSLGKELLTLSPSPDERLLLTQQLAALLHRMGRASESEALLNGAIQAEQDPDIRQKLQAQLRGVWRHTEGRTSEVVSNLTQKVAVNPSDEASLRELGDIYVKSRRDYAAAKPVYEKLAELKPNDSEIQTTLLGIYKETGDFDGMRRVYEARLTQAGKDDPTLRFQIATTELQAGRGDTAVAYAEQHLSGAEASPFQLQMLSKVYEKSGRKEQAIATLDTAIARETNAQQRLSMQFQKADMMVLGKRYAEAETMLRLIRNTNHADKQTVSRVNSELVRIYQMQGRISELNL